MASHPRRFTPRPSRLFCWNTSSAFEEDAFANARRTAGKTSIIAHSLIPLAIRFLVVVFMACN
jgi:hypothetical protein